MGSVRESSIENENIDILTTHHYPNANADLLQAIKNNRAQTLGKKPYFVGEFGFIETAKVQKALDLVIDLGISGALLWSLRFHNRDGGFYWHSEPAGLGKYKAYHWPGFASGSDYDEKRVLWLMREKAFQIRGLAPPPIDKPSPPFLLPIDRVSQISWRGSAGAGAYDVERSETQNGPWVVVGRAISDAAVQYRPLFDDKTAKRHGQYFYRVKAKNSAGVSPPSNVVGPIEVKRLQWIDECRDLTFLHESGGTLSLEASESRQTREDIHRFKLEKDAFLIYKLPEPIHSWKVCAFLPEEAGDLRLSLSKDGETYVDSDLEKEVYFVGSGDYAYQRPVLYQGTVVTGNVYYMKIESPPEAGEKQHGEERASAVQISRIEIDFGDR